MNQQLIVCPIDFRINAKPTRSICQQFAVTLTASTVASMPGTRDYLISEASSAF